MKNNLSKHWEDEMFKDTEKHQVDFPLAFVAGLLQGHWWGLLSRNYVVWPIFFLMNVFIALKGTHFLSLFDTKHRTAFHTLDVALFGDFCLLVCITNNMMPSRHRCQVSIFSRQHTGCDPCLWLFLGIVIIIFSAFSWSKTENDLVMQNAFVLFVLRFYGTVNS